MRGCIGMLALWVLGTVESLGILGWYSIYLVDVLSAYINSCWYLIFVVFPTRWVENDHNHRFTWQKYFQMQAKNSFLESVVKKFFLDILTAWNYDTWDKLSLTESMNWHWFLEYFFQSEIQIVKMLEKSISRKITKKKKFAH